MKRLARSQLDGLVVRALFLPPSLLLPPFPSFLSSFLPSFLSSSPTSFFLPSLLPSFLPPSFPPSLPPFLPSFLPSFLFYLFLMRDFFVKALTYAIVTGYCSLVHHVFLSILKFFVHVLFIWLFITDSKFPGRLVHWNIIDLSSNVEVQFLYGGTA